MADSESLPSASAAGGLTSGEVPSGAATRHGEHVPPPAAASGAVTTTRQRLSALLDQLEHASAF